MTQKGALTTPNKDWVVKNPKTFAWEETITMPKEKGPKKGASLRHAPLGNDIEQPAGKLRAPKAVRGRPLDEDDDSNLPSSLGSKIYSQARSQRLELSGGDEESFPGKFQSQRKGGAFKGDSDEDDDDEQDDDDDDDQDYEGEELVEFDGEIVAGTGLSEAEEAVVQRFLGAGRDETRTLADIIMDKIREKGAAAMDGEDDGGTGAPLPPKVVEVYTAVGKLLAHYKSGKLPKALKMLPHLKNWEEVLWLTRPDQWSPCATYACTRIFASNLNAKLSQRFLNLVLLEKCRDDIQTNKTLNYHLYMALKKALFKPAAFYKGILLPIAQSQSCTLREAVIIGSVLAKVSIPGVFGFLCMYGLG